MNFRTFCFCFGDNGFKLTLIWGLIRHAFRFTVNAANNLNIPQSDQRNLTRRNFSPSKANAFKQKRLVKKRFRTISFVLSWSEKLDANKWTVNLTYRVFKRHISPLGKAKAIVETRFYPVQWLNSFLRGRVELQVNGRAGVFEEWKFHLRCRRHDIRNRTFLHCPTHCP